MMSTKSVPKSVMARDQILSWIQSGKFSPGQKLPSEQSIGQELGINHVTVRRGLKELSNAGLIQKRPRVGNFVSEISNPHLTTHIHVMFPAYMATSLNTEDDIDTGSARGSSHPVPGIVVSQLCKAFSQRKYSISPHFYNHNRFWIDSGAVAVERGATGVIIWPDDSIKTEEIEKVLDAGIKVVLLREAPQLKHLGLFYVEQDHGIAMAQILDRFLKLGHRNIATIRYTARPDAKALDDISAHYFKSAGIIDWEKNFFDLSNSDATDYSAIDRIFDLGENFPTAVVVPDGYAGWEFFRRCYKRNIRIPDDVSVAALSNSNPHVLPIELSAPDTIATLLRTADFTAEKLSCLLEGEELVERAMHLRSDVIFTESVDRPRN